MLITREELIRVFDDGQLFTKKLIYIFKLPYSIRNLMKIIVDLSFLVIISNNLVEI